MLLKKFTRFIGAFLLWLLAVIGAIAVAVWLHLPTQDARLLVIAIAFIAFFGAFLPILRLSQSRRRKNK